MGSKSVLLTIAGSDPFGGAGIQADLKTAERLGCYGCSVITALTAQNSHGVADIWPVGSEIVETQLLSLMEDIKPDAVKIGMIADAPTIKVVGNILKHYNVSNIVVDPVLTPTKGKSLIKESVIEALYEYIFPIATLITPNLPESKKLSETVKKDVFHYNTAVLLKGGHSDSEIIEDILIINTNSSSLQEKKYSHARIPTINTHGSGCVLSSAIACGLAKGYSLEEAVEDGIRFITCALSSFIDIRLGSGGYGPTLF